MEKRNVSNKKGHLSRRTFLKGSAATVAVLSSPWFLNSCGGSGSTGTKTLHFALDLEGFLSADEEYVLHCGGKRYSLVRHTAESKKEYAKTFAAVRKAADGLMPLEPSHYAEAVVVSLNKAMLIYVTQQSDVGGSLAAAQGPGIDHGLALMAIHTPTPASGTAGGFPIDINQLDTYSPLDIAKTIIFTHPEIMKTQQTLANDVYNGYLVSLPGMDDLAYAIKGLGQHGWYSMAAVTNDDGSPYTNQQGEAVYQYVIKDAVNTAAQNAMTNALNLLKNMASLQNTFWTQNEGTSFIESSPSSLVAAAAGGYSYQLSSVGQQYGVQTAIQSVNGANINLKFTNNFLRHLCIYVRFFDENDGIIQNPAGWTEQLPFSPSDSGVLQVLEDASTKYLSMLGPVATIAGVPVDDTSTGTAGFSFPDTARYAELYFGSLGQGFGLPDLLLLTPGLPPDVQALLTADPSFAAGVLTLVFEIGVPAFLLAAAVGAAESQDAISKLYRNTTVVTTLLGLLLSEVFSGPSVTMEEKIKGFAVKFANFIVKKAGNALLQALLEIISIETAQEAIPVAGLIANGASVAATIAQLAQTSYEATHSPSIIDNRISRTHDINIKVSHDQNDNQFPAVSTYCIISATFSKNDTRTQTIEKPGGTWEQTVSAAFSGVPAGGNVRVFVGFYSDSGWLAGQADVTAANVSGAGGPLRISLTIKEQLVPLCVDSVYTHSRILQYAPAGYAWASGSAPTGTEGTVKSCDESGNSLCELGNITFLEKTGAIGYVWRSNSPGISDCDTGGTGQLYTFQNIASATSDADPGYAFSGCGLNEKPYIIYDLLGPADGSGNNFLIRPEQGAFSFGKVAGYEFHVRRIQGLGGGNGSFSLSDVSYGKFPVRIDGAALHPQGLLLGVNTSYSKLFVLRIPDAGVAPEQAPRATMVCGPATSYAGLMANKGLLYSPTAVAIGVDSTILVLCDVTSIPGAGSSTKGIIRAFDKYGNPVSYFNGQYELPISSDAARFLDMGVESQGYIYILSYSGSNTNVNNYHLDIYRPDGSWLTRTSGMAAGRMLVDLWRNVFTMNWDVIVGRNGHTEPSISEWIPPAPPADGKCPINR